MTCSPSDEESPRFYLVRLSLGQTLTDNPGFSDEDKTLPKEQTSPTRRVRVRNMLNNPLENLETHRIQTPSAKPQVEALALSSRSGSVGSSEPSTGFKYGVQPLIP